MELSPANSKSRHREGPTTKQWIAAELGIS